MSALERAKNLAKKTNAAIMVVNETTDEVFVVMTMDEYERLVNQESRIKNQGLNQKIGEYIKNPLTSHQNEHGTEQASSGTILQQKAESGKPAAAIAEAVAERPLQSLTEEELLSKMSEQIREWRSAQVDREQIVLAEMPKEVRLKDRNGEQGAYNLSSSKVNFKVDNLEEEERFFLDNLD